MPIRFDDKPRSAEHCSAGFGAKTAECRAMFGAPEPELSSNRIGMVCLINPPPPPKLVPWSGNGVLRTDLTLRGLTLKPALNPPFPPP